MQTPDQSFLKPFSRNLSFCERFPGHFLAMFYLEHWNSKPNRTTDQSLRNKQKISVSNLENNAEVGAVPNSLDHRFETLRPLLAFNFLNFFFLTDLVFSIYPDLYQNSLLQEKVQGNTLSKLVIVRRKSFLSF